MPGRVERMFNKRILGRNIRGMRIAKGFDSVEGFVRAIKSRTGVEIALRSIGDYERGQRPPSADALGAILVTLDMKFETLTAPALLDQSNLESVTFRDAKPKV